MGEERYEVHNFGLGSTTVIKSGDHPYWYTQEFNESIAMKPDIVIIQLGTNDAKVKRATGKCDWFCVFNLVRSIYSNRIFFFSTKFSRNGIGMKSLLYWITLI